MNCALGFDVGTRLIGVAVGNAITASARALGTVHVRADGPDWAQLDEIVRSWQPDVLVIGLPLALDDGEQPMTRVARRFAQALEQRYRLPLALVDERHSSQEASRRFAAGRAAGLRRRRHAAAIDADAAAVILERWLSQRGDTASP